MVTFENYTDELFVKPFGDRTKVKVKDVEKYLESRCFPRERANVRELLDSLGLDIYDPLEICKITKGKMYHSNIHLEFKELGL